MGLDVSAGPLRQLADFHAFPIINPILWYGVNQNRSKPGRGSELTLIYNCTSLVGVPECNHYNLNKPLFYCK
jgi:hypothetical protein